MLIAEIGQNHCGDMKLAQRLISAAKENGADLVKFQLYNHKILYKDHPEIPDVELSFDQAQMLFNYGKEVGIEVFFSVFDVERVGWCEKIGVKRYKIASNKTREVVGAVRDTRKPVIISFNNTMPDGAKKEHKFLFCISEYPATIKHLELIKFGDGNYSFDGFSDHTIGLDAAKMALARGATIIEKHFAIDHKTGVDAEWSMTPDELKELRRFHDIVAQSF